MRTVYLLGIVTACGDALVPVVRQPLPQSLLRTLAATTSPPRPATALLAAPAATSLPAPTLTKSPTLKSAEFVEVPDGVTCARGVCALGDDEAPDDTEEEDSALSVAFLWPRALLLASSVLYGTNFPLGRLMNDALPASASTSARFVLAFAVLAPFLPKLAPELRGRALLCGCFTALGYVAQSLALVDTPAATVSFLGCLTVLVCPALSVLVDGQRLGFRDAPQVWVAAALALAGVGALELGPLLFDNAAAVAAPAAAAAAYAAAGAGAGAGAGAPFALPWGDIWSVLQAVGFGTSFFLTERMMARAPGQALPITAAQCGVTAAVGGAWAAADGAGLLGPGGGGSGAAWLLDDATRAAYAFPGLVDAGLLGLTTGLTGGPVQGGEAAATAAAGAGLQAVAAAAAWTGLVTTAGNRVAETTALGKVSSSEASVLLATEPLWAVVFASLLIGESMGRWDAAGGALLFMACLANAGEAPLRAAFGMSLSDVEEAEPDAQGAEEMKGLLGKDL